MSAGSDSGGDAGDVGHLASTDPMPVLCTLMEAHEEIDWREVPEISPSEAGAWVARLQEAAEGLDSDEVSPE